jgi:hypothetical protein
MMRSKTPYVVIAALALAAGWSASPGSANEAALRLHAVAVDVGGPTLDGGKPATTTMLDIGIERFTSDVEAARLAAVLAEKGADALLRELQKMQRVGYIRTPGSLAWDIHYARMIPLADGSKRIIFATDRPMNFYELWNRPRSVDYQYLLGEVRLGPDGKGQGTLVPAARVDYNEETKTIEIENYAAQPVRLVDVRVES